MMSSKKLNRMARKWQKMSVVGRKRIPFPGSTGVDKSSQAAEKGHFVIYTTDQKRHVVPLAYLSNNNIFVQLLKLGEEEFGLSSHEPIRLPCDSALLEYIVFIVQQGLAKHLEKALLTSISPTINSSLCTTSSHQGQTVQHSLVCGY